MLGFPLIMHKELLEGNLEVSSPSKTAAGYSKSEAEPDKGIGPLFPHLKAVSLGMQKLFLPLRHIDGTSEDITLTTAAAAPPYHHRRGMQSSKTLPHVTL